MEHFESRQRPHCRAGPFKLRLHNSRRFAVHFWGSNKLRSARRTQPFPFKICLFKDRPLAMILSKPRGAPCSSASLVDNYLSSIFCSGLWILFNLPSLAPPPAPPAPPLPPPPLSIYLSISLSPSKTENKFRYSWRLVAMESLLSVMEAALDSILIFWFKNARRAWLYFSPGLYVY